jgi:NADH dehydrogenase FAD-containing subunit
MRILVLGAGFGGLELTTRLSEQLGDSADVVLIDHSEGFVFGFSKLDVMFGRTTRRSAWDAIPSRPAGSCYVCEGCGSTSGCS